MRARHRGGVCRGRGAWRWRSSPLRASSADKVSFQRYGKFRYQNQEHTTEVLVGGADHRWRLWPQIEAAFHDAYEREYTYRLQRPVELVGIHLVASAEVGKLEMKPEPLGEADATAAVKGHRDGRLRAGGHA